MWRLRRFPSPGNFGRNASFLTALGESFDAKTSESVKFPSFRSSSAKTGLFGYPELVRAEGFQELKENCINRARHLVDEATSKKRTRNITGIFDELSDELCRVADMAEFLRTAHPDQKFASAAEDACIAVSNQVEALNIHRGLYDSLYEVSVNGDIFSESEVDKRVARLFLLDFQQSGIHLSEDKRRQVVRLNDNILQLGQAFTHGAYQSKSVPKTELPEGVRHVIDRHGDYITINGLMSESPHDIYREAAYRVYYWYDKTQEDLLSEMLKSRYELAELCGYETFAHRSVLESLGQTPENINEFLTTLSDRLKPLVASNYASMNKLKERSANFSSKPLEIWDVSYFTHAAKRICFKDEATISEYFSLGVCMDGLNTVLKKLFSIELVHEIPEEGEVWHKDVRKIAVNDDSGLLGYIYCDFFNRPGKPHQDCHFTIRGGRELSDGSYQTPMVVLMLSLPSPSWNRPSLLSHGMVDNLFHEMGHAIHSMLARTKYQHVTGTRCSTDFAEVPSTLMEYFANDPRVLSEIGRHFHTGASLPNNVVSQYVLMKKMYSGVDIHTQLVNSITDQRFHGPRLSGSPLNVYQQCFEENYPQMSYPKGSAWHQRFSHLVGYGARYYSYLMARAVASTIWRRHFLNDPLNFESGSNYRNACLVHGGSIPSYSLVSSYIKRPCTPEVLAEALIEEIEESKECQRILEAR